MTLQTPVYIKSNNNEDYLPALLPINSPVEEEYPLIQKDNNNNNGHSNVLVSGKVAVWNLFADVLGPGAVAIPFYIAQSGLAAGMLVVLVMAVVTSVTLDDIYMLYVKTQKKNYPDLARSILGMPGYIIVCFSIFCFNFGGLCGQLMLFGSVIPDIMLDFFGTHELFTKTYLILFGCIVFLPISTLKDIAKFSFFSFFSVSCVFIISGLIFFRVIFKKTGDFDIPGKGADTGDIHPFAFAHHTLFSALGGLAYIFVCHDLSFNVIGSLRRPSTLRYRKVVAATMLGTVATCFLIGVSGYLLFFEEVQQNILQNFPRKDAIATVGRCFLAAGVTLAVPFSCFMPRVSIVAVISSLGERPKAFATSNIGHFLETLLVLGSGVTIAIFVNDLGKVFELVGGVSACSLAFLLPPILVVKGIGFKNLSVLKLVITLFVFLIGLVIMFGTVLDVFIFDRK